MTELPSAVADWLATELDATIISATSVSYRGSPWMVALQRDGERSEVVCKAGPAGEWSPSLACEAAAMQLAGEHGLAAPRLLAAALDTQVPEHVAIVMSKLDGDTTIVRGFDAERLRTIGRLAAMVHRIPLTPSEQLPVRVRHTSWTDYAGWRRWANRYQAAPAGERDEVVRGFMEAFPGWGRDETEAELQRLRSTPLLDEADERLRAMEPPGGPTVFVHGDLWHGNTTWADGTCTGFIDWEAAGAGHPGVDLGCVRFDAALLFGPDAPDQITAGWEQEAGRSADAQAYWDVVAALNCPADAGVLVGPFGRQGRDDLDGATLNERRDDFLRDALARL